jgi:hypothetical protein
MENLTLYEIGKEEQRLMALLEETGGEVTPEVAAALDAIDFSSREKVDRYCYLIRTFRFRADTKRAVQKRIMEEAKPFGEAAQRDDKSADRMLERLLQYMDMAERDRIETSNFTVVPCKNPPAVDFPGDAATLPEQFRRTKYEPIRAELLNAWKRGEPLPEGVTVKQGRRLEIR